MAQHHVKLKRRPFLAPIWLSFSGTLAAFLLAAGLGWVGWTWVRAHPTTVIVVRHAEKSLGADSDPPLTPAGQARAELLAQMFGAGRNPGHIDAIFVSPTLRSRMTAAPLAARLGLTPIEGPAHDVPQLVSRLLHEHAGSRVLVIGHSDTVTAIVERLSGAEGLPLIADDEYGTMYIVTVPRIGRATFLRLTY